MKKAWGICGLVCLIAGPAMVQAADPAPPENRYSAVQAQRQAERVDKLSDAGDPLPPLAGVPVAIKDVLTTTPDAPAADAARILERHKYGCLPVVSGGKLMGILTEADFLRFARVHLEQESSAT